MNLLKSLAIATLPLLGLAAPAFAADLPSRLPPEALAPLPVANWAGFYAGSIYGYGHAIAKSRVGAAAQSVSVSGQTGGALIGYSWQTGRYVYGIEGDLDLHLLRGSNSGGGGLVAHDVDSMYTGRLRARLGYDLGNFLPFVAGGVAVNESYLRNARPLDFNGAVNMRTGFTLGAGVDWKLTVPIFGQLLLRGEYVFEKFGSHDFPLAGGTVRSDLSSHFFRVGILSRFGDKPLRATSPAFVDWSGAYGGVFAGGGSIEANTHLGALSANQRASGAYGGIYTGRNFQFGQLVVGLDASTSLGEMTGTGPQPGIARAGYRTNAMATTRGRLGYAFGEFLPFVSAGLLWGRSTQTDLATGSLRGRVPSTYWTVGGGLDYRLTQQVSLRTEYLFAKSFERGHPNLNGIVTDQDTKMHLVRAGVAYHFQ